MEKFYFKPAPDAHTEGEKLIFEALNGRGYIAGNELHICGNYHFVYKFTGDKIGWYMKNPKDDIDRYLGRGACPSVMIDVIDIKDKEYFESIKYSRRVTELPVDAVN